MTQKDIIRLIAEGKNIEEIIDSKLNVISSDEVQTNAEVTNNSTTNSFVDATAQQVGKNRYNTYYLEEANSQLQGKSYSIPDKVLEFLRTKTQGEGSERVNDLLKSPKLSYEQIKRFKHDIEHKYTGDWKDVLEWINHTLNTDRDSIARGKEITHDTGMQNRYRDEHEKDAIKAPEINKHTLFESTDYGVYKKKALKDILNQKISECNDLRKEIAEIKKILKNK